MDPLPPLVFIALVSIALGVIAVLWGIRAGGGRRSGWVTVTGRWIRGRGIAGDWRVEYPVEDRILTVHPHRDTSRLRANVPVQVAYDPSRPSRAVIDTFMHNGGFIKLLGGIFVVVGLVLLAIFFFA